MSKKKKANKESMVSNNIKSNSAQVKNEPKVSEKKDKKNKKDKKKGKKK